MKEEQEMLREFRNCYPRILPRTTKYTDLDAMYLFAPHGTMYNGTTGEYEPYGGLSYEKKIRRWR